MRNISTHRISQVSALLLLWLLTPLSPAVACVAASCQAVVVSLVPRPLHGRPLLMPHAPSQARSPTWVGCARCRPCGMAVIRGRVSCLLGATSSCAILLLHAQPMDTHVKLQPSTQVVMQHNPSHVTPQPMQTTIQNRQKTCKQQYKRAKKHANDSTNSNTGDAVVAHLSR